MRKLGFVSSTANLDLLRSNMGSGAAGGGAPAGMPAAPISVGQSSPFASSSRQDRRIRGESPEAGATRKLKERFDRSESEEKPDAADGETKRERSAGGWKERRAKIKAEREARSRGLEENDSLLENTLDDNGD